VNSIQKLFLPVKVSTLKKEQMTNFEEKKDENEARIKFLKLSLTKADEASLRDQNLRIDIRNKIEISPLIEYVVMKIRLPDLSIIEHLVELDITTIENIKNRVLVNFGISSHLHGILLC